MAASEAQRRRRPPSLAIVVVVAALALVVALVGPNSVGRAPGPAADDATAPTGLQVQAGVGASIVAHWTVARRGPPASSYQVRVVAATGTDTGTGTGAARALWLWGRPGRPRSSSVAWP